MQETGDSGLNDREYTTTGDRYGDLVSQYGGGQTLFHEFDPLGSTSGLLDDSGSETDRYRYRAFGLASHTDLTPAAAWVPAPLPLQPASAPRPDNDRTFVGKLGYVQDSEIDLYCVRDRYYDPDAARWLSEDPDGYRGGDANLYRYCANDPVNHVDPSGNAILIPREDTRAGGCAYGNNKQAYAADVLRDQLWAATGAWQVREARSLALWHLLPNGKYYKLSVFPQVPADTWGKLDASSHPHADDLRANLTAAASVQDLVLTAADGRLRWAPYPDSQRLADRLDAVVAQLAGQASSTLRVNAEALRPLLKAGLAGVALAMGVSTDELAQALEFLGDLLPRLIRDGKAIIDSAWAGTERGLQRFCGSQGSPLKDLSCPNILNRLLDAVADWLRLPELKDLVRILTSGGDLATKLQELAGVVLKTLGLDWDGLLEIAGRVFGEEKVSSVLAVARLIGSVIDEVGAAGGLSAWLD